MPESPRGRSRCQQGARFRLEMSLKQGLQSCRLRRQVDGAKAFYTEVGIVVPCPVQLQTKKQAARLSLWHFRTVALTRELS